MPRMSISRSCHRGGWYAPSAPTKPCFSCCSALWWWGVGGGGAGRVEGAGVESGVESGVEMGQAHSKQDAEDPGSLNRCKSSSTREYPYCQRQPAPAHQKWQARCTSQIAPAQPMPKGSPEVVHAVNLVWLAVHHVAKRVARAVDLLARDLRGGGGGGRGVRRGNRPAAGVRCKQACWAAGWLASQAPCRLGPSPGAGGAAPVHAQQFIQRAGAAN